MTPRILAVNELVHVSMLSMVQAMKEPTSPAYDATAGEVMSAIMTMALRAVKGAVTDKAPLEPWRQAIAKIYAELPPERTN